jgi:pimeloyl-ACP methyl ester carboxylesterase
MGPQPLHGVESGSGSPTVVLLHGYGATGFTWRHWVPSMERSHRVLNLDLKGFGDSGHLSTGGFSPVDHAAAVVESLDPYPDERLVLAGHSLGGGIALLTALAMMRRHDTRLAGLVLVSAAAYADRIPPFVRIARAGVLGRAFLRFVPKALLIRTVLTAVQNSRHPPDRRSIAGYAEPFRRASHRAACVATALQIIPRNLDSLIGAYPSIHVPALLVWGDGDRVSSPETGRRLAEALPRSRLEVIRDCGHMPQDEQPEATLALVNRFLRDLA